MVSNEAETGSRIRRKDVRDAARKALAALLEPLAGFVLDSGLTARELNSLFRAAAVQNVAASQLEKTRRINISGIAASTGVPRGDIARILARNPNARGDAFDSSQQTTSRILSRWHDDPQFTDANGQPADLKVFGRGATFEALAKSQGRGLPMRAMLDELVRIGAVELLPSQRVRAKTSVAIDRGTSPRAIKAFGDRASELLSTLLQNMRSPENPRFVANVERSNVPPNELPLFRKELSTKAADFLTDLEETLEPLPFNGKGKRKPSSKSRISVTVFYSETIAENRSQAEAAITRKNFSRETS